MQGLVESPDVQRALIARAITEDHADVVLMSAKIDKLSADVETLMELFRGAKSVVRAVTWIGGLGAGLAALWHLVSPYVTFNQHK